MPATLDLRRGQVVGDASRRAINLNTLSKVVASATYAPLASPTFTGDPKAPTPAPGDNDTSVATTEFVHAAVAAGRGITQLTGDATAGPGSGSQAITLVTVMAGPGTYNNVTINAKGLATAGSNVAYLTGNQTITLSGDISGSGTTAITTTLATVPVAKGGTNKTSWTTGSVAFAGSATALAEDNNDFFWDNTNKRLGLGTAGPTARIHLAGAPANTLPALAVSGSTTSAAYSQWTNTSGNLIMGVESSAGANIVNGGTAYSTVFGTQNAQNIHLVTNNTARATIDSAGGMTLGSPTGGSKGAGTLNATNVYAAGVALTSDARSKRDIAPLSECLGIVEAVTPKSFRWAVPEETVGRTVEGEDMRAEELAPPGHFERTNWGFVAQDLADTAIARDAGTALDLGALVAVLWQAVRELSARLDNVERAA